MSGFRNILAFGLVCSGVTAASAADVIPDSSSGSTIEIFLGGDFTEDFDAQFGYAGISGYLTGDADIGGFFLSGVGSYGHYDYPNGGVPGGEVDGYVTGAFVGSGYKAVTGDLSLVGLAGLEYRDRNLKPDDPFSDSEGDWFGAKISGEIEYHPDTGIYADGLAEYSTINNMYFVRLRVGPSFGAVGIGPEVALVGEDGWEVLRYGAFLKLEPVAIDGSADRWRQC